jgi:hypothetical protein
MDNLSSCVYNPYHSSPGCYNTEITELNLAEHVYLSVFYLSV